MLESQHIARRLSIIAIIVTFANSFLSILNILDISLPILFKRASRVELPEIPPEEYSQYIESCIRRFRNPHLAVKDIEDTHPPIKVVYKGDMAFLLAWRARSGTLSLHDDNFVEAVQLEMRVVRNFRAPNLIEADIVTIEAKQTRWPPDKEIPSDAKFTPFDEDQKTSLKLYSDYLASYLTNCTREQVSTHHKSVN
ncbi:hypothetical protein [Rhodopseudomonas palustris]|uniref:hypothetical protein n=1 Tax=Rhodopseudomonas palustris TaxID=1076 RepID=UPI003CC8227C